MRGADRLQQWVGSIPACDGARECRKWLSGRDGLMVSPVGIDNGNARPEAGAVLLMSSGRNRSEQRPGMVSRMFASWSQLNLLAERTIRAG